MPGTPSFASPAIAPDRKICVVKLLDEFMKNENLPNFQRTMNIADNKNKNTFVISVSVKLQSTYTSFMTSFNRSSLYPELPMCSTTCTLPLGFKTNVQEVPRKPEHLSRTVDFPPSSPIV